MALNLQKVNESSITLNNGLMDIYDGNLIAILNNPNDLKFSVVQCDSIITYIYTGNNINIINTGTYDFLDNSEYNSPTGHTGLRGEIGVQGRQGFQGLLGYKGNVGSEGVQGNIG
jgi:hypothetical protein